jgi:hypothetical protein
MFRGYLLFSIVFIVSCGSGNKDSVLSGNGGLLSNDPENKPVIEFVKTVHDFGKITQGEVVGTTFIFKNTGRSNLIIHEANASCGCTVPRWIEEPVPPGEEGTVEVVFDSSGRMGIQNKSITVQTNAENATIILSIKAEVL